VHDLGFSVLIPLTIVDHRYLQIEYNRFFLSHYDGDRLSIPRHYTLFHVILESGNEVILRHYLKRFDRFDRFGCRLATMDNNHGHKAIGFLIYSTLGCKAILGMTKILYESNPLILNMETSRGFGLPLDSLINKMTFHMFMCHNDDQPKDYFQLGAYLLSKGAKWRPDGTTNLGMNCNLWYRKMGPQTYEILVTLGFLPLRLFI
jgi:hypothetical protein